MLLPSMASITTGRLTTGNDEVPELDEIMALSEQLHWVTIRAMLRFRQMKSLQKFAWIKAKVQHHCNPDRRLIHRQT